MSVDSSKIHQNHWIITEGFLHVIGNNMRVMEGNFPTEQNVLRRRKLVSSKQTLWENTQRINTVRENNYDKVQTNK